MQYYTAEEVMEDIFSFEGCNITVRDRFDDFPYKVVFFRLYSEYRKSPLPDTATLNDLKESVREYAIKNSIPEVDVPIDENAYATIYGYNVEKDIHERVDILDSAEDLNTRFKELVTGDDYVTKYTTILIVHRNHEDIMFFNKKLN